MIRNASCHLLRNGIAAVVEMSGGENDCSRSYHLLITEIAAVLKMSGGEGKWKTIKKKYRWWSQWQWWWPSQRSLCSTRRG
jgi:hypothetical protein